MDKTKSHAYQQDVNANRMICICGKLMLDRIHSSDVVKITGTAKPTKTG